MTERTLHCQSCGQPVQVHELPRPFIDPTLFTCGHCLNPKEELTLQLEPATETRTYDPAIAAIPY